MGVERRYVDGMSCAALMGSTRSNVCVVGKKSLKKTWLAIARDALPRRRPIKPDDRPVQNQN